MEKPTLSGSIGQPSVPHAESERFTGIGGITGTSTSLRSRRRICTLTIRSAGPFESPAHECGRLNRSNRHELAPVAALAWTLLLGFHPFLDLANHLLEAEAGGLQVLLDERRSPLLHVAGLIDIGGGQRDVQILKLRV